MSLSGMVRRMAEAGAPPEAIAIALEEIEAVQAALDARRVADRDRKRAQRERRNSADVTGHSEDCPETVTGLSGANPSLDKEAPQTPKEIKPIPCVREPRSREGWHRLPEAWTPSKPLPPKTQAKVDQWPPGALEAELAALHRWAANAKNENGKGKKLDWDKAWVNWIERRNDEHYGRLQANRESGGRMGGPGADPTLALVRAATAAQRPDGGDRGQAGVALPARQFG